MSIYIVGKSECCLCGKVILENDHLVMFRPFIANTNDPLFIFSDNNFHKECVEEHSLFPSLVKRYTDVLKQIPPKDRLCEHCNQKIEHPDEIFLAPYISYGHKELEKFDNLWLHKHCLPDYIYIKEFYDVLSNIKKEGWWGGRYIDWCMSDIEQYCPDCSLL